MISLFDLQNLNLAIMFSGFRDRVYRAKVLSIKAIRSLEYSSSFDFNDFFGVVSPGHFFKIREFVLNINRIFRFFFLEVKHFSMLVGFNDHIFNFSDARDNFFLIFFSFGEFFFFLLFFFQVRIFLSFKIN
jgi:hypothetical protein